MKMHWAGLSTAALLALTIQATQAEECSVSSSVTTGPDGTVVTGTPGKTVTIYDSEGRPIGVIARDDCGAGASGSADAGGASSSVSVGGGTGSSSVTAGSGSGSSTTSQGGVSSSVTVGPGGVSGQTTTK